MVQVTNLRESPLFSAPLPCSILAFAPPFSNYSIFSASYQTNSWGRPLYTIFYPYLLARRPPLLVPCPLSHHIPNLVAERASLLTLCCGLQTDACLIQISQYTHSSRTILIAHVQPIISHFAHAVCGLYHWLSKGQTLLSLRHHNDV